MRMTVSEVSNGTPAAAIGSRDGRPAAGGDHDPVRGERVGAGAVGPLDRMRPVPGEPGVAEVDGDVGAAVHPVLAAAGGDRVDPAEDPVPDVGPAHLVDARVDPVAPGVPDVLGDVGGVDVHLGRDAADVQAGAAEDTVLDERRRRGRRTGRR